MNGRVPHVGEHCLVQPLAFGADDGCLSTADLGSWTVRSRDQAVYRLCYCLRLACQSMREAASRSRWRGLVGRRAVRQLRGAFAAGGMFMCVIADGHTHYEMSARPVHLPYNEDQFGVPTATGAVPPRQLDGPV